MSIADMAAATVAYISETAAHDPEIEDINAEAFGPGRFSRAAYSIREKTARYAAVGEVKKKALEAFADALCAME